MIATLLVLLLAQTQNVEVEPVTCWWRTTAVAVRVGEPFTVLLTCSLLQTEAARVVADESRLEPSVVQLPPFEVLGGARARDVTTADRRFVQFEYRLRAIADNVFASEVALPALEVAYRIESRVSGGESLAGRDLTYALPPLTMRVLSLVPDTAADIREAPVSTFAEIEDARSRGTMLRAGAAVALTLGLLLLALAASGAFRRRRAARPAAAPDLSRGALLRGARRELASVRDRVRASGWTSDLAGRALAAVRVISACATGRPVAQRFASATPGAGEIVVNGRIGRAAAVSSPVTATDDPELDDALGRLTAARYGRQETYDGGLDDAIDAVVRRAERLIAERPWAERLWRR